jgi:hypothetical protein
MLVVPDDAGPLEDLGDVLQGGSADSLRDDLVPGPHDLEGRQRGMIKVAFTRTIKRLALLSRAIRKRMSRFWKLLCAY